MTRGDEQTGCAIEVSRGHEQTTSADEMGTRRGVWWSEIASGGGARVMWLVLLRKENKSVAEQAVQKRSPQARRASAGLACATACCTCYPTLMQPLSVLYLYAAACPAATSRAAG